MQTIFIIISLLSFGIINGNWNNSQKNTSINLSPQWSNVQSTPHSNGSSNLQIFTDKKSSQTTVSSFFILSPPSSQEKVLKNQSNLKNLAYSIMHSDGRKEIVDKEKFNKELYKATDQYLQSAQNYFGADMKHLAPTIKHAILQGTINSPEMQNTLMKESIIFLVKSGQTDKGIISVYRDHPWVAGKDLSNINVDDQIIINYAISRMTCCEQIQTIELAQGCLQAFDDYQQAENITIQLAQKELYLNCYQALQSYTSVKNRKINLDPATIQKDLITIVDNCTISIDSIINSIDQNNIQMDDEHEKYLNKLYEREAIIIKTLQGHPSATEITHVNFNLPADVCGYLMANNINYASFNNQNCIYYQHVLTSQIIELLKTNVDLDHKIINNDMLTNYIKHTCNLAVTAQQLNQEYQIAQATLLTDLSEIATIIGESACQATINLGMGIGKGSIRSLQSWLTLACNLCVAPIQTTKEGIKVLCHVARFCGELSKAISSCIPTVQMPIIKKMYPDSSNRTISEILIEQPPLFMPLSERYELIKTNINLAMDYSIPFIQAIRQRHIQENIADFTQFTLDSIIMNKIGQGLSYITNFGQSYLSEIIQAMNETIPAEFMPEPLTFATTPTGEIIAYMENTGEVITDAMLSTTTKIVDGTMLIAQGNNLYTKVNNFDNNSDKYRGENKGKASVSSEYTYKHGTYDGADYHKKNKTTNLGGKTKSPSPEDGQKCLDNSYGLDKYVDRVAIEDNKYVVLYSSNNGTYHGFVCTEWKDVPKNMKEIFKEHKLVHPKSGSLKK